MVVVEPEPDRVGYLLRRLEEGLEQGITLVMAKAVIGLLGAGTSPPEIERVGVSFGTRYREAGWGAGLTVLSAMANVLAHLDPADRALALVHGLALVSRDTRGRPPRFPLLGLGGVLPGKRLGAWYRRFVEARSADAAERTLASAIADPLVAQTASASRSEEQGSWRYPHDLAAMIATATAALPQRLAEGARNDTFDHAGGVAKLGWSVLAEDPTEVVSAIDDAIIAGATAEELGRAVAYGAALRITRFHTQNDHGDWDQVHHAFTAANALHQALVRAPTPELVRGVYHGALRIYLDRFLNIPAARLPVASPTGEATDLTNLGDCWDHEGQVNDAVTIVYRYLRGGGDPARVISSLGHALLTEDAEFHWFQIYEAAVRQFEAWPAGSEEGALILAGAARFLAAHTPHPTGALPGGQHRHPPPPG